MNCFIFRPGGTLFLAGAILLTVELRYSEQTHTKLKLKNSFGSFAVIIFVWYLFYYFVFLFWFKWNLFLDILPKFSFSFGFYGNSAWCINCC